jgi:hypothetical protein
LDRYNINLSDHREHNRRKAECPWRAWYKSPIWKTIKRHRLVEEPNCRKCASEGKTVPASHVAHIEHHQGEWGFFSLKVFVISIYVSIGIPTPGILLTNRFMPIPGSEIEPTIAKNFLNDLLIQPIKAGDLH